MRFIVVGTSGSGKSTFARTLAESQGCAHVELDDLFWGPGWTPKHPDDFAELARCAASGDRWVIDGNYSIVREIVWPRGTQVVWLNLNRATVMFRISTRTIWRAFSSEALWHGNRESVHQAFFSRKSILVWSATTYTKNKIKYAKLRAENAYPQLHWIELRSTAEAKAFLAQHSQTDA